MSQDNSEPAFEEALLIDQNPVNNVVASPDGRVFINLTTILNRVAVKWTTETMVAQLSGDEKALARIEGAMEVLSQFLYAHDGSKVGVDIQRRGEEVTMEKVAAGIRDLQDQAVKMLAEGQGPTPFS